MLEEELSTKLIRNLNNALKSLDEYKDIKDDMLLVLCLYEEYSIASKKFTEEFKNEWVFLNTKNDYVIRTLLMNFSLRCELDGIDLDKVSKIVLKAINSSIPKDLYPDTYKDRYIDFVDEIDMLRLVCLLIVIYNIK